MRSSSPSDRLILSLWPSSTSSNPISAPRSWQAWTRRKASPMFVSTELAARIDRAEARLSTALGRAVVERKQQPDAFVEEVDAGVAVYAGPSSPINKMIGVGFAALPTDERLQAIEEKFA